MKKIKVLSLFDGISVAQQALKELGYTPKYYASEIDPHAIAITQNNHPETIQLGSVKNLAGDNKTQKPQYIFTHDMDGIKSHHTGGLDLLIGGSPCQDLSLAKANRQGLKGDRSSLFYEYVRILQETKPKYFVLENVASMRQEDRDIITAELGVEPIMIDASLVSAQSRKRYFWTNIPNLKLPENRNIFLRNILDKDIKSILKSSGNKVQIRAKSKTVRVGGVGSPPKSKSNWDAIEIDGHFYRPYNVTELERLQSLPDNYTNGVSTTQRKKAIGNAFNKEVVKHILKNMEL